MELRQFVESALSDIVNAVSDTHLSFRGPAAEKPTWKYQTVDFEVAVSVSEKSGGSSGLAVVAGLLSIGGAKQTGTDNQASAIIRFSVPVYLPSVDDSLGRVE